MGTTAIVTPTLWASQNDVALTAGQGKTMLENQLQLLVQAMKSDSYVVSGATVPANSANLTLAVAAGSAYINGVFVTWPSATTITNAASNTNYIYVQLTRGSNLLTGAQFNVNTTGTAPDAYSLLIAKAVTSGSAVTSTVDCRTLNHGRKNARQTVFTSGGTFTVPGGVSEIKVRIWGAGGGAGGGGGGGTGSNGGGGGAGGYTEGIFPVTPGATYTVTIGTGPGGAGGTSGNPGTAASTASTTSVGALCSATGGGGGPGGDTTSGNTVTPIPNLTPGVGSGGALNLTGGGAAGSSAGGAGAIGINTGGTGGTGGPGMVLIDY